MRHSRLAKMMMLMRGGGASPAFWVDADYDHRTTLTVTNDSGITLHDHLISATVPGVNSSTVAVETTAIGTIDRAWDWRYYQNCNRMSQLPLSVSGNTVTLKTLGRWVNGETRYFTLYWKNAGGTAPDYHHLVTDTPDTAYYYVKRGGPDTEFVIYGKLGLPLGNAFDGRIGIGHNTSQLMRIFRYRVNGSTTNYGAIAASQETSTVDGPTITVTGNITCSTRSDIPDWVGVYSAVYSSRIIKGKKSDNSEVYFNKHINVVRYQMTLTCQQAFTPQSLASAANFTNFEIAVLYDTNTGFAGNVTIDASNALAHWYDIGEGPVEYLANADLRALPVTGTKFGRTGNLHTMAMRVHSANLVGWTGQPNADIEIGVDSNGHLYLNVFGTTSAATIPVGARIELDVTLIHGVTTSATTVGDVLLPYEASAVLDELEETLTVTVGSVEAYGSGLSTSMQNAGGYAVEGIEWFMDNALAKTGMATNYAYQYNVQTGIVALPDDDDGNYGQAHKLHGLCLRYLRTHDAALIPLIEAQAQFHIDIEQAAVTAYGNYWLGSAPHWYCPPTSVTRAAHGGVGDGTGTNGVDPEFGEALGEIIYTQGQVSRQTSIDQMHMVAHGLYAYLYLLRNEAAITANATLQADVLSLLSRMVTFEADKWMAANRICGNLYELCSAGTPANNNGLTEATVANPYHGALWGSWQVDNTDNLLLAPSSNSTIDDFYRAVFAPNSQRTAVTRYLQGRVKDMMTADASRHDVVSGLAATVGVAQAYPAGWQLRSGAVGNTLEYDAAREGEDHYIGLASGGVRDAMSGRAAQRLIVLCLAALFDRNYQVPLEMDGATVLRSAPIVTLCDETAATLAAYGPEPTTKAMRFAVGANYGVASGANPQIVDSAFTGYWMMALELWYLVRNGANVDDYYPIANA